MSEKGNRGKMLGAQIDHLTHSTYTAYFLYEEEMPVRLYERFFQELRPQIKEQIL